ncbi:hypothetical protein Cni_G17209 [Canna indica]|uniref:Uncharacterized protein n=1 Tax=Canna indica TaxID=4628 RepID=A0AAQ3KMA3_9LILI|nr:hypothetical protein Cni_G17209 [Canna indica]
MASLADVFSTGAAVNSCWNHHEPSIDELKRELLRTTMELEELRLNSHGERQRAREDIRQLVDLLEVRTLERDEARNQVQILLGGVGQDSNNSPEQLRSADNGGFCGFAYDEAAAVVDSLAVGRPLPERGRFVEAVLGAGPLLKNLMAAAPPLPQWRNPPQWRPLQAPSSAVHGAYSSPQNSWVRNL